MACSVRWAVAALAALTAFRLVLAALLPLSPDEAYYWVWSRALAPGYVDHPPMVALWIRTGTLLLGETPLGVRLMGPLAAALGTLFLADTAERVFPNRNAGLTAGGLWNATLWVGAGSVVMTPDAPLLLFWCATVWAMARVAMGGGMGWWLVAGTTAGLALASKYTAVFLWIGIGTWVLAVRSARRWLRNPTPWIGALLGLVVFMPVLLWNADHGWVSFLKQGGRVTDWRPERAAGFLAELVGGQIGLMTPGIWVLCVAGLVVAIRTVRSGQDSARIGIMLAFSLPPAVVFLQHAFGDRVQGNWPAIVYPAAIIAAAGLTSSRWRHLVWPSAGLGFFLTALVVLQATTSALPLPASADPAARQLAGWSQLANEAAIIRQQQGADYVVAEEYALIAELAWNTRGGVPVVGIERRLNPMTLPREDMGGRTGVLVRAEHRGEKIDPATWSSAVPLGFIERNATRGIVERYRVWRVVGRGPGVAMPSRAFATEE